MPSPQASPGGLRSGSFEALRRRTLRELAANVTGSPLPDSTTCNHQQLRCSRVNLKDNSTGAPRLIIFCRRSMLPILFGNSHGEEAADRHSRIPGRGVHLMPLLSTTCTLQPSARASRTSSATLSGLVSIAAGALQVKTQAATLGLKLHVVGILWRGGTCLTQTTTFQLGWLRPALCISRLEASNQDPLS